MSRARTIRATREETIEDIQNIQDGTIAHTALGFSRAIAAERIQLILQKAFARYREETLSAEQSLTMIAQMVGLDDLRLALESRVQRGLVSAERREANGKGR